LRSNSVRNGNRWVPGGSTLRSGRIRYNIGCVPVHIPNEQHTDVQKHIRTKSIVDRVTASEWKQN